MKKQDKLSRYATNFGYSKRELETKLLDRIISVGVVFIILFLLLLSSCRTVTNKTYYESGQIKSEYKAEGFIPWSDGEGKNLPLSHINVQGVGF